MIDRRTDLPLPALLFDGDLRVNAPIEAFTFFVTFDESIMLPKVMPDTRLPTTCSGLEFVPGVLLLNVVVDLLKVHLATRGRRYGLVNEYHIVS